MRRRFLSARRSPAARPLLFARRLRPRGGRRGHGRCRRRGRRAPVRGHGRVRPRLPWRLLLRRPPELWPLRRLRPRCPLFGRALCWAGPVLLGPLRLLGLLGRRRRLPGRRCGHGRPRQEGLGYRVLREGARRRRSAGRDGGPLRPRVARPGRLVGAGGLVGPRRLDGVGRRRKRSRSRIARHTAGRGALAVSGRVGGPAAGRGWPGAAGPAPLAVRVLGAARKVLVGGGPLRTARRRAAPPLPGVVAAGRSGLAVHRPGVPSRSAPRRLLSISLSGLPVRGSPRPPAGRVPGVRRRDRVPPAVALVPGLLFPGRGSPFRLGSLLHGYSPPSTRARTGPAPSTERSSASAATN